MSDFCALNNVVRAMIDAPNFAHLSTIRSDGTPRNWVVWVGREGDRVFVCTGAGTLKAMDMLRNPAVALSIASKDNPYQMMAIQGRVVEVRDDNDGAFKDMLALKYTGQPYPRRGGARLCFVVAAVRAASPS
jgi:PPOX class probable F420-dependent enzyme